jgi:anaerobic C4-dicarboxylate transporter
MTLAINLPASLPLTPLLLVVVVPPSPPRKVRVEPVSAITGVTILEIVVSPPAVEATVGVPPNPLEPSAMVKDDPGTTSTGKWFVQRPDPPPPPPPLFVEFVPPVPPEPAPHPAIDN